MKLSFLLYFLICYFTTSVQNWTSWTSVQNSSDKTVQYCYLLIPRYTYNPNRVSAGNSFALKVRNNTLSNVCGQFKVILNLTNGQRREELCSFQDLRPGSERLCPGVSEFSGIQSFSSITNISIEFCGGGGSGTNMSIASFSIDYHNSDIKSGTFKFIDPKGQYSFETHTSSGHNNAANNPYTQQFKKSPDPAKIKNGKVVEGYGTIPSGTWYITGIKDKALTELVLKPGADVINPNDRGGFLIHGYNTNPADASTGCIILERQYREKLMNAFLRDGKIELVIKNKAY